MVLNLCVAHYNKAESTINQSHWFIDYDQVKERVLFEKCLETYRIYLYSVVNKKKHNIKETE